MVQHTAVPSMATTPSPRTTRVVSLVMGLSSRTAVTSTSPVMVSPGRQGEETPVGLEEDGARAGQLLCHHRVQQRAGDTALQTIPPNRVRAAISAS